MPNATKVLFVCVHNAGRSQMAEALLRKLGGSRFDVSSAGFEPRAVNPLVIEALGLMGIDIREAKSKSVFDLFRAGRYFDYVITVCDESNAERCPVFPGFTRRLGWNFEDPSAFTGTHAEQLAKTVAVREAIKARIESWLVELPRSTAESASDESPFPL